MTLSITQFLSNPTLVAINHPLQLSPTVIPYPGKGILLVLLAHTHTASLLADTCNLGLMAWQRCPGSLCSPQYLNSWESREHSWHHAQDGAWSASSFKVNSTCPALVKALWWPASQSLAETHSCSYLNPADAGGVTHTGPAGLCCGVTLQPLDALEEGNAPLTPNTQNGMIV